MKNLLFILIIILHHNITAQNIFYVSNSSEANFSCLEEVNSAMSNGSISDGSTIYLKSQDIFSGTLKISRNNLIISSYGDGNNPIFDGEFTNNYGIVNGSIELSEWEYFHNITVTNIVVRNYLLAGIRIVDSDYWTIRNIISHDNGIKEWNKLEDCDFYEFPDNASGEGIQITGKNITVEQCEVFNNGNHGIFLSTFSSERSVENVILKNNKIYNNHHSSIDLMNNGGPIDGIKNIQITANEIFDTYDTIDGNYLREIGIMIQGYSTNSTIDNVNINFNLLHNIRGIGVNIVGAVSNIKIHHNTIYNSKASSAIATSKDLANSRPTLIEIYNNIGDNDPVYEAYGACDFGNSVISITGSKTVKVDNNIWYNWVNNFVSLVDNENIMIGNKNLHINPLLNSDFFLEENSPARKFGKDLGYLNDKNNSSILLPPDLGAFQYNSNTLKNNLEKLEDNADVFSISNNFPNPFSNSTSFEITLPIDNYYEFVVFDILGKQTEVIFKRFLQEGVYKLKYSSNNLSSGLYFARLLSSEGVKIKKIIKTK